MVTNNILPVMLSRKKYSYQQQTLKSECTIDQELTDTASYSLLRWQHFVA